MRVLRREGVDDCNSGRIYLAVVQSVMLYESKKWVIKLLYWEGAGRIPIPGGL